MILVTELKYLSNITLWNGLVSVTTVQVISGQSNLALILATGRVADGNVPVSGAGSGITPGHGREAMLVCNTQGQTPPVPLAWGFLGTVSHQEIVTGQ